MTNAGMRFWVTSQIGWEALVCEEIGLNHGGVRITEFILSDARANVQKLRLQRGPDAELVVMGFMPLG